MPVRSNDFQRLVYLVKLVVATADATVTESKFLIDRHTREKREVDVCIEATVGGHVVIVCLECYDHKRKATVEWVDRMIGKHDRLPTKSLVLASRSGFSKGAISAAAAAGAELLTYATITEQEIEKAIDLAKELWAMTFELAVMKVVGDVPAQGELSAQTVEFSSNIWIFDERGTRIGNVAELAHSLLTSPQVATTFQQEADESHRSCAVEFPKPTVSQGSRVYVRKKASQLLRPIDRLVIHGRCRVAKGRVRMQHGVLGTVRVAWGTTVLRGRDAMLLAVQQESGAPTVTLHLAVSEEDTEGVN